VLLLFVSLCIIVMFDILSFSFKSIPFLINIHFDVMMMMSTFNKTNTLSCIYIVLDQWKHRLRVDVSLHIDIVSWFWTNQSLLLLLNVVCLAENQKMCLAKNQKILIVLSLVWRD
jgi:hypothetical protein